jgi:flagellin
MALSLFTNAASMSSTNALNQANSLLSTSMERLGTGKRINSAADDAAGMQIATRLTAQSNGMGVAQRNISDATSMLQTGEGAFDEVTNIMYRMKDLATQGANDTNTAEDRTAINSELSSLNDELNNIMQNTKFGGERMFADDNGDTTQGKLGSASGVTFQIGASSDETLTVNLNTELSGAYGASGFTNIGATDFAAGLTDTGSYQTLMDGIDKDMAAVGDIRSSMGATINRLGHTSANLANMKDNTDLAAGNITDADFATEASSMSRNQMLAQTSMSMLKQSNSMSGMVMSLLG